MQNYKIDNLVSIQQNNQKLIDGLELIKPRQTSGSLAAYDGFESEELLRFRKTFCHELEDTITGSQCCHGTGQGKGGGTGRDSPGHVSNFLCPGHFWDIFYLNFRR